MRNIPETVKQLIIINIIFFIGTYIIGQQTAINFLGLYFPENPNFKLWQPVTHMFMHGGIMHILFNMFALYSFGSLLEQMWGGKKFLFFYFSCGLGAALLHVGVNYITFYQGLEVLSINGFPKADVLQLLAEGKYNPQWEVLMGDSQFNSFMSTYLSPTVGASGAIYGILVAFAFVMPNAELMLLFLPVPIKAKYFVPGILAMDLFLGLKGQALFGGGGDGVAHFAHLGGALIGFLMMWYWKKDQFKNNRWN